MIELQYLLQSAYRIFNIYTICSVKTSTHQKGIIDIVLYDEGYHSNTVQYIQRDVDDG